MNYKIILIIWPRLTSKVDGLMTTVEIVELIHLQ